MPPAIRILAHAVALPRTLGCWQNPHWNIWCSRRDIPNPKVIPVVWNFLDAPDLAFVLRGQFTANGQLVQKHDLILFERGVKDCRIEMLSHVLKIYTTNPEEVNRVLKSLSSTSSATCVSPFNADHRLL